MLPHRRPSAGFSLIELLMVIVVMGILVGLVLPNSNPSLLDQLRSGAQILRTDLAYGQSLAVANNSTYRFTFDAEDNRYTLYHSGANAALDALPDSPFRGPDDPPDRHVVDFDELPHVGPTVRLIAAGVAESAQRVSSLQFGPAGETTRNGTTMIWLGVGSGSSARYISLAVHPTTGLVELGDPTRDAPPPWALLEQAEPEPVGG